MGFELGGLPPELILEVLCSVSAKDLCRIRQVCHLLREAVDNEQVWIVKAKNDFRVKLSVSDGKPSPRYVYQNLLYRYKALFGKWQRQNLRFYSSVAEFLWDPALDCIVFDNLLPTTDLSQPLVRKRFLEIGLELVEGKWKSRIQNLDRMTNSQSVTMALDPRSLDILISNMKDYITSPAEWRELLTEFKALEAGTDNELSLMKFVSLYHSRSHFSYTPLFTDEWIDRHLFGFQGLPIRPGLFQGTYGAHGVELVHLQVYGGSLEGAQGIKVTGDPNVPFNEVTFRVLDGDNCLDLTDEEQISLELLQESLDQPRKIPYQDGLSFAFCLPDDIHQRAEVKWSSCKGRWSAEGQIAQHMFQNPHFIGAHFIVFSKDEFAVIYLDFKSISMFHRVK